MLTEFWHRSRARQRRILSEVGQIELAVERENPRKSPEIIRDSQNKLARVLIVCAANYSYRNKLVPLIVLLSNVNVSK